MRLDALVHSRKLQITKKCAKSETKKSKGKFLLTRRYSILSQYSSLLMRYSLGSRTASILTQLVKGAGTLLIEPAIRPMSYWVNWV